MLSFLPKPILFVLSSSLFVLNVLILAFFVFYPLLILKLIFWYTPLRGYFVRPLLFVGELWVYINNIIIAVTQNITWDIQIDQNLSRKQSYMVIGNHQSWVDIPVMQRVLVGKMPFPRFFLKQQLIYVPILGGAWWGLDFPFMKRFSREYLQKHPQDQGKDIAATIKSCEKFKTAPVTIINYLEGTRFTKAKHQRQQSPYQHLLKPKSAGFAYAIQAMDGAISHYLDMTIYYPSGKFSFGDLFSNNVKKIVVRASLKPIPEAFLKIDYQNNADDKARFQEWISSIWQQKDDLLKDLHQNNTL